MKRSQGLLTLTALLSLAPAAQAQNLLSGRVVEVLGGDDLLVEINGRILQVDLAYIRPPLGTEQPWDHLAAQELNQVVPPGTLVQLDPAWVSADGRLFAYVYNSNGLVNSHMLATGRSVSPWQVPDPVLNSWYREAEVLAQLGELGVYQPGTVISPQAATPAIAGPRPFPMAPWGIGALILLTSLVLLRGVWKRPHPAPWKAGQQLHQLQTTLVDTLTQQKQLQQQYDQAQHQVELWEKRVELALEHEEMELAEEARSRCRHHTQQAESIKQTLEATTEEVTRLRHSIAGIQPPILPNSEHDA